MKEGAAIAALALLLIGCQRPYRLDPRWLPLKEVVERPDGGALFANPVATTIAPRVYVSDLEAWLQQFPPGSPELEAILLHEREHAVRQVRVGVGRWLARYLRDPAFMWREEQAGWTLQLNHLQEAEQELFPAILAEVLASYRNLTGRMVPYDEALAWVVSVLGEPEPEPDAAPPPPG